MTTPAGSHTAGDTTGSGSAATEHKSFQGAREVEELKASDLGLADVEAPTSADRVPAPELERWASNQRPKTMDWAETRLFRYGKSDLYQWWGRRSIGIRRQPAATWDACDEPFVIARRSLPSPEAGGDERPADAASALELLVVYMAMEDAAQATHCERLIKSAMRSPAPEAGEVIAELREWLERTRDERNFPAHLFGWCEEADKRLADLAERQASEIEGLRNELVTANAPEAGGVIVEAREATLETGVPRIEWVVKQMRQATASIQKAKREKHTKPDPILAAINALPEWCTVLDAAVFEVECDYEAYEDRQAAREIIAALKASPPALEAGDLEAIKKAAYKQGWDDREGDLTAGAARVYGSATILETVLPGLDRPLWRLLAEMRDMADWIERTKPQGVLYSSVMPSLREGVKAIEALAAPLQGDQLAKLRASSCRQDNDFADCPHRKLRSLNACHLPGGCLAEALIQDGEA